MPEPAQQQSSTEMHAQQAGSGSNFSTGPEQQQAVQQQQWGLHKAEVGQDPDHLIDLKPYLAKCSCGTEGRFQQEQEAYKWLTLHLAKHDQPLNIGKIEPPATGAKATPPATSAAAQESHTKPAAMPATGAKK